MLEKFRRKIVLINVLFIGTTLVVVCAISFLFSKQSLLSSHTEQFISTCTIFEEQMISTNTLNYRDVQDFKIVNNIDVFLLDNGRLIDIRYGKNNENDNELLEDLQSHIDLLENFQDPSLSSWEDSDTHVNFQVTSMKQEYFARYIKIQTDSNNQFELIIARSMEVYNSLLLKNLLVFIVITIFSFIIIFILNHYFAKLAIAPAIKAQKSQIEFITAASHELKTPIAVIQSSTEMLTLDKAHSENYITNITSETKRMKRLVDDLLLLSGLDSNRSQFQIDLVNTETLLLSIYEMFIPLAHKTNHFLELLLPADELPAIQVDPDRMVQVLAILLDNAFSYTPIDTKIEISARESNGKIYISIIDHGNGIKNKDKVFERFYRNEKSRTTKNHFGLGLSIAYEIIKKLKGNLAITDTDGGGATFTIKLPYIHK